MHSAYFTAHSSEFQDFGMTETFDCSSESNYFWQILETAVYKTAAFRPLTSHIARCPRGVMVKAMNCGIVVREFVLQSRYYVHFRANTLGKGMNPLILPPAMGK